MFPNLPLIEKKVTLLRGETATLDSSGAVTAHLNRDAHLTVGNYVEIVGKVNQDLSVRVLRATDLGRDGTSFLLIWENGEGRGRWEILRREGKGWDIGEGKG